MKLLWVGGFLDAQVDFGRKSPNIPSIHHFPIGFLHFHPLLSDHCRYDGHRAGRFCGKCRRNDVAAGVGGVRGTCAAEERRHVANWQRGSELGSWWGGVVVWRYSRFRRWRYDISWCIINMMLYIYDIRLYTIIGIYYNVYCTCTNIGLWSSKHWAISPSNAFRGRVADDDRLEFTLRMTWNSKLPKNYGTYENSSKIIQNPMVAASRFFLSWLAPFQLGIPVPF